MAATQKIVLQFRRVSAFSHSLGGLLTLAPRQNPAMRQSADLNVTSDVRLIGQLH